MKTILVDAIYCLILEDGTIFQAMHELLEQYPNDKIVLTGADDEQFKRFNLDQSPYQVFTLKHDPDKTNPDYFNIMLAHFGLTPDEVVYFEHSAEAVKSAESVGIKTYFYDNTKEDLKSLKMFIDASI